MSPVVDTAGRYERSTFGVAALLEYRDDRARDHSATHIVLPNGSVADTFDWQLAVGAQREAMALWSAHVRGPVATCDHCGEVTHYQRGVSRSGGVSQWVHTATGQHTCADGAGYATRPADWNARRAS